MSTAISTNVKTIEYAGLVPGSRQLRVIEHNLDGEPMTERDLVRVKTPAGGATKWTVNVGGNDETMDEIVGLLVAVAKRGVLWPQDDPTDQRPVLVTHDLQVAYRVSDDLGTIDPKVLERYRIGDRKYDWTALSTSPEFGYGSARGGSGKRVKESRMLAILRDGETWPFLVTVGPGSLAGFLPWYKRLPSFPWECVVGLKLEKVKNAGGQPYSAIVPRVVGTISEEQGEIVRRIYAEPLQKALDAAPAGAVVTETVDEE